MVGKLLQPVPSALALALFATAALGQTQAAPPASSGSNGSPVYGPAYPGEKYRSDRYPAETYPSDAYPTDQTATGTDNSNTGGDTGNNAGQGTQTENNSDMGVDVTGEGPAGPAVTTQSGPVQKVHPRKQSLQATEPAPSFLLTGLVGLAGTYTTNVSGTASGSQGEFDGRLNLGLNALERSASLTAALSYTGQLDVFTGANQKPVIGTNLTGLLDYEAIPDHLRFDLRTFATPVLLNPLGSVATPNTPLPQGSNSNVSDTYGYQVAPDITFRFGGFATSELVPSYGTVWFVRPDGAPPIPLALEGTVPPPQMSTASVVEKLKSGDDFSRLYWQITGNYLRQSQSALGLKQSEGTGDFEYAITHTIDLLLMGGYQSIDADTALSQNLTGPIAYAGLRFRFSPYSMFEVRAGENYNSPSYTGDAAIAFSPATGLTGSLADSIQTPAGRLLSNLSDLDVSLQDDGSYQFFDSQSVTAGQAPSTLQAFQVTPQDNLGFNNVIERYRTGELGLYHKFPDATDVTLNGFGTIANILSSVPANQRARQVSWGAAFQVNHPISPDLTVGAFLDWGDQTISFGSDQYVSVGLQASYSLSKTLSVYGSTQLFDRISSSELSAAQPISGSANVATFTIGITKSF